MSPRFTPPATTHRPFFAHYAMTGLAAIGAAVVQTGWASAVFATTTGAARPLVIAIVLCTTLWTISTAWLHWRLRFPAASRGLAWQALQDLCLAAVATAILIQGHESPISRAGLWAIPPVLLALAVPSALVLLDAARIAPQGQAENSAITRFRSAMAIALLACLVCGRHGAVLNALALILDAA